MGELVTSTGAIWTCQSITAGIGTWTLVVSSGGGGPPSGAAGGSLSGTYPNPGLAALSGAQVTALFAGVSGCGTNGNALNPATGNCLAGAGGGSPTGAAGGALSGTYPNPGVNPASVVVPNPAAGISQTIAQQTGTQLHLNNVTVFNGALIDRLTALNINNAIYVDGVSAAGVGQAPVAWAASTFYPQCQEVSHSGGNYLAIPETGDSVTTPGTNSQIWYPITNGSIPTALDCAFYIAAASIVSGTGTVANGAGASIILGSASNYYTNIGLTEPTVTSAGQPVVNIFGQGRTVTTIKQGSAKGDGFPTLYQPPATTGYAFASFHWEGFTVNSNFVAPAVVGIYGAQQFSLHDLYLLSATDGSDHYMELGNYSDTPHGWTYEPDIENVDLGAGAGFGRGAIIATTVSGGVPSFTVTAGGSGFTSADTQVILAGTSDFGRPCNVMGTTTATIVSGAITAITSSATGCIAPLYTIVYGGANINYGYKFSNVSDRGKIFGLTNGGIGWIAGMYMSNVVNAITVENYHPISTLRGVQIYGGATFEHLQCDTIYQYCADIESGAGTVNLIAPFYEWNNPNMTGSRDLFFGLVSGTPGYSEPQAVNIYGEICGDAAQQPGYAHFDSAAGVIDSSVGSESAFMPVYVHDSNPMYCNQLGLGNNSIAASPSLVGQHITMSNGAIGNQWDFNLGTAFINGGNQTLNVTQVNSSNTSALGKYVWNFTNANPATSGQNYASPNVGLQGTYWNGSVSTNFGVNQQLYFASGANPAATYQFSAIGTPPSGGLTYKFDNPVQIQGLGSTAVAATSGVLRNAVPSDYLSLVGYYTGTYSGGTTYKFGDIAVDGSGNNYVSLSAGNVGNALTNTTYWHFLGGVSSTITGGNCVTTGQVQTGISTTGVPVCAAVSYLNGAAIPTTSSLASLNSSGQITTTTISAPPYFAAAGNLYIPADGMYLATLPSFGSWTALGTGTYTNTSQTNGDVVMSGIGSTGFQSAPTQHTSIETSGDCLQTVNGSAQTCGIYFYDSTNSRVQIFVFQADQLLQQIYTYSGTGAPSYSSSTTIFSYQGHALHLKGVVSGTSLVFSYSTNGGIYFAPLTAITVGTVTKMGIFSGSALYDIYSVVVN